MHRYFSKLMIALVLAAAVGSAPAHTNKSQKLQKQFVYIKALTKKNGRWYLSVNDAQYLTGKAAIKAARKDGVITSDAEAELVENMYIRKTSNRTRDLPIAGNPNVLLLVTDDQGSLPLQSDGKVKHSNIPLAAFANLLSGSASAVPHLYVNNTDGLAGILYEIKTMNQRVIAIEQVYTP